MSKIGPSDVPGEKAGPNGSFPIGDKKHARLAISGASRSERAGNISEATAEHIKAKARAKLGDGHTTSGMDQAMQDHADKMHPRGG
jgi:hypothetical protein